MASLNSDDGLSVYVAVWDQKASLLLLNQRLAALDGE
jgi:hypothetical protein